MTCILFDSAKLRTCLLCTLVVFLQPSKGRSLLLKEATQQEVTPGFTSQCGAVRFQWQHAITQKCKAVFGEASHWDKSRLSFCDAGFSNCITPFYAQCCTAPEGAKLLTDYCRSNPLSRFDWACTFEHPVRRLKGHLLRLIGFLDLVVDAGETSQETKDLAASLLQTAQEAEVPELSYSIPPVALVDEDEASSDIPQDPCQLMEMISVDVNQDLATLRDEVESAKESITSKADYELGRVVDELLLEGDRLVDALAVKACISAKTALAPAPAAQDEDDDAATGPLPSPAPASSPSSALLLQQPMRPLSVAWVDDKALAENAKRIEGVEAAIQQIMTKVHPHGPKWWRYRYEYAAIELCVLALEVCLLLLILKMLNLSERVHKSKMTKTLKSYNARTIYKYTFHSFLSQGASIAIIIGIYWLMGWLGVFDWIAEHGEGSIFGHSKNAKRNMDKAAGLSQEILDTGKDALVSFLSQPKPGLPGPERMRRLYEVHLPLIGQSYMMTFLDVAMHTYVGFFLYAFLIAAIIRKFVRSALLWRFFSDPGQGKQVKHHLGNLKLIGTEEEYNSLKLAFQRRMLAMKEYRDAVSVELDDDQTGLQAKDQQPTSPEDILETYDFHRYLTLHMRDASIDLCGVYFNSWLLMAAVIACGAPICLWFEVDFVGLLVPLLAVITFLLVFLYIIERTMIKTWVAEAKQDTLPSLPDTRRKAMGGYVFARLMTDRHLCQFLQFSLLFICYSFARVISSYYMWADYPIVATFATVSFIIVYLLFFWLGGEVCAVAVVCFAMPPLVTEQEVRRYYTALRREPRDVRDLEEVSAGSLALNVLMRR